MKTVWIATNARGDVIFVFSNHEKGDAVLRVMKCHPQHGGRGKHWYVDADGNFAYHLAEWFVTE